MAHERVTGRTIERTYDLGPGADVHLNNVRGWVRITGTSSDTAELRLEVDPERHLADEDLDHAPIDLEYDGQRLHVKVVTERLFTNWFEGRGGPPEVHCTLRMPNQGQLSVNTVSATVAITNVQGPCHANTVSGDIATTTINGPFHGNTVSGNAILADSAVALNWNTVSGDLIVRTSEVSSLQANSVSGSVTAELPAPPSDGVSMQSVSGDLTLVVPATFNCVAQLTSMNGRAHVDLPATVLEERRGRWQARINGGGPSVRLSTMSGSLRIHRNDGVVAGEFASGTVSGSPSSQRDEELRILRQIERREISIDEGLARLEELRRARAQEGEQHVSG